MEYTGKRPAGRELYRNKQRQRGREEERKTDNKCRHCRLRALPSTARLVNENLDQPIRTLVHNVF